jgi:response regulator RpfG family c-di-GMP phosphodiesterase
VAIIAANPALTSILAAMLAEARQLRVRQFESEYALRMYMRIVPVELVVADFDCEEAPAVPLAQALRRDLTLARRDFQVVALARELPPSGRHAAPGSGIDEVIIKPMSPKYLLERVLSRLGVSSALLARSNPRVRPPVLDYSRYGDNVVSLMEHRLALEERLH